ncbi:hypothetical protein BDZ91DRAFT_709893 [Kalaharituber pfeilii]|nr:hypothetical protein BDZ91DRAFT_709893 [Kalaharituber pfeilii]
MDDNTELELARFRSQWQQEVSQRARGQQQQQSKLSATAAGPSRRRPSVLTSSRPSNFPHAVHARTASTASPDGDDDGDGAGPSMPLGAVQRILAPEEASASKDSIPTSAMEHFQKAIEKEAQGSLGDSLNLYRKAYKLDPKIDSKYREKYFPRIPVAGTGAQKTTEAQTSVAVTSVLKGPEPVEHPNLSSLIASFSHLRILGKPLPKFAAPRPAQAEKGNAQRDNSVTEAESELEPERGFSLLASLPRELLLHVLRDLAHMDIASFARMALVCKGLAFAVATEESIWKDACEHHKWGFPSQVWNWKCGVLWEPLIIDEEVEETLETEVDDEAVPSRPPSLPSSQLLLSCYSYSYKLMFQDRPRIRYNGLYISTCNYIRPGIFQSTATTHAPVHIVTYYRYLRFYADGTVISLLSTHEPSEVVYGFSKQTYSSGSHPWGKHVLRGRWRIDPGDTGDVDVETESASGEKYLFKMGFTIRSAGGSKRGGQRQNKLVWRGFWSWNRLTDDVAEFSLRHDKPFFWSRVKSYDREGAIA